MENKNKTALLAEFEEFGQETKTETPPVFLTDAILAEVTQDLNPSALQVFGKTSLVHLGVGGASLLFCPQFGLSYTSSLGLMPYLMKYGDAACMLGCGVVFTAVSLIVCALVLKPEEVKVLERNKILQLACLTTLSLGALLCLGAEVIASLALVWGVGAIVGGIGGLELTWYLRRRFARA